MFKRTFVILSLSCNVVLAEPNCPLTPNTDAFTQAQASNLLSEHLYSDYVVDNSNSSGLEKLLRRSICQLSTMQHIEPTVANVAGQLREFEEMALGQSTPHADLVRFGQLFDRDAGTGYVVLPTKDGARVEIDLFETFVDSQCQTQSSAACGAALSQAKQLWDLAGHFRAAATTLGNTSGKQQSSEYLSDLNAQWQSYKDDTILLWPQEVLLNSIVFKPESRGFTAPPNYKLMSLRPSIGLSYLSDQDHHIQPTLNLDLLGVYWWKYQGTKAQAGRGIAATLVWDGEETALGISYHHSPTWSVTLASSDEDDVVVSLSFQLAHWLLKKS